MTRFKTISRLDSPDVSGVQASDGQQPGSSAQKAQISLRSLQIFECVARRGSTVKAAEELGVTQSAISHQLKHLSTVLGESLFEKSGRTLKLTEKGAALARELSQAFLNIGESVNAIVGRDRNRVRLAVCSSFGMGWFAPRMRGFMAENRGLTLDLLQFGDDPDLTDNVADAFVTALPAVSGFTAFELFPEQLVAVASPQYQLEDTVSSTHTLISTTAHEPLRSNDWLNFQTFAGRAPEALQNCKWIHCTHYVTALALAESHAGIALLPDFLAERAIAEGRLVRIGFERMGTGRTYRLCIKTVRLAEPALMALRDWFETTQAPSTYLAAAQ